jgi:glucose/arabinose dehydrogenase
MRIAKAKSEHRTRTIAVELVALAIIALGCDGAHSSAASPSSSEAKNASCVLAKNGYGRAGAVPVRAELVVDGLEVPWGIAFPSAREMLVTERPGRVRLVRDRVLVEAPVATLPVRRTREAGLLGIALHPGFGDNRFFYLYFTADGAAGPENRVERWKLAQDGASAERDRTIIEGIPSAELHDGGRLRFGPDGMLYVGTGDARDPDRAQDPENLAGKILRLKPDGGVPADNPFFGKPAFLLGIRNTQGFDWTEGGTLIVTDHGPSGDLLRRGHDEVNVAAAGVNLGWPTIYGCGTRSGMASPLLTWEDAVPAGGAAIYRGRAIPEWKNNLLIGTLASKHLHRVVFDGATPPRVIEHDVYFRDAHGRLRDVVTGPDGELYLTTSNCDGRGDCPKSKDSILRITR